MSHVLEHCNLPAIRGRDKRAGTVWACSCGRLYRTTWSGGYGGLHWKWERFTPKNGGAS
jgi:hypothetical protein